MRKVNNGEQHLGLTSSTSSLVPDISTWPETGVLKWASDPEKFVTAFYTYERSKLLLEYALQGVIAVATDADGRYVELRMMKDNVQLLTEIDQIP